MHKKLWMRDHGGEIIKEKSWRSHTGVETTEETKWGRVPHEQSKDF